MWSAGGEGGVRTLVFLGTSLVYGVICTFAWFQILLKCGLGSDSSERCSASVDHNATMFVGLALIAYDLFVIIYWRGRRRNAL